MSATRASKRPVVLSAREAELVKAEVAGGRFADEGEAIRFAVNHAFGPSAEPAWLEQLVGDGKRSGPDLPVTAQSWLKSRRRAASLLSRGK